MRIGLEAVSPSGNPKEEVETLGSRRCRMIELLVSDARGSRC